MSWSENSFWNWQRAGELVKVNGNHRYLRDQPWAKTFHAAFMGRSLSHTSCLIFSIIFVICPWFAEIEIRNDYCMSLELLETGSRGGAYVGMAGLLSLVIGGNLASEFITQKAVFAATQLTERCRAWIPEQWSRWILVIRLSQSLFRCILCILHLQSCSYIGTQLCDVLLVISLAICLGLMLHLQVARNSLRGIVPYQPAVGLDHRRSALHWQQCHHGHRHLWKEVHDQGLFFEDGYKYKQPRLGQFEAR